MCDQWKKYNHAFIPTTAPHITPDILKVSTIIKKGALLARWTSDFDCGYKTEWWYCIKDEPFDINNLKAKRRYEINKGLKNITIKQINQVNFAESISEILISALEDYPKKYKPKVEKIKVIESIKASAENQEIVYLGCFDNERNALVGYGFCKIKNDVFELVEVKVLREFLSTNANASLIYYICQEFLNTKTVKYISDGERNLRHETNYQDYLIKYFGFRKAYCKLNILYSPIVKIVITMLYQIRGLIKNTNNRTLYNIYCLLKQEEIRRSFI